MIKFKNKYIEFIEEYPEYLINENANVLYCDKPYKISFENLDLLPLFSNVKNSKESISLDESIYGSKNICLADLLEDKNTVSPEIYAKKFHLKRAIDNVLKTLNKREENIIKLRFGIDKKFGRSIEEIAELLDIKTEEIQKIEEDGLRKLRHYKRLNTLVKVINNFNLILSQTNEIDLPNSAINKSLVSCYKKVNTDSANNQVPNWDNFESMIKSVIKIKSRDMNILKQRMGIGIESHLTLESIGNNYNITRERVRQILQNIVKKLSTKNAENELNFFWYAIEFILEQNIGLISSDNLSRKIDQLLMWKTPLYGNQLLQFLKMFNKFEVENNSNLIGIKKNKCNNCLNIFPFLYKISQMQDKIYSSKILNLLKKKCCSQLCPESKEKNISFDFVKHIIGLQNSEQNQIIIENDYFINFDYWNKENESLIDKILKILLIQKKAIHITEIVKLVEQRLNLKINKHNLSSLLARNRNVLLWDRGTFIHKNNIKIPIIFLEELTNYCIEKLNSSLPFLAVTGIYDRFKRKCILNEIPSYTALYSLFRDSEIDDLVFPYYPTIFLKERYSDRISISTFVENYLFNQNKPIAYTKFKEYFQDEIGVKSYSLQQICSDSNVIVKEKDLISHKNYSSLPVLLNSSKYERKSIKRVSGDTLLFRSILFNAKEVTKIENQNEKYYSFSSEKGIVITPILISFSEINTLRYKLYEKILDVKYDEDPKNPGSSLISWDSQLIIEPEWQLISKNIYYAEFEYGRIIICRDSDIDIIKILNKITNNTTVKKSAIDMLVIENLQLVNNQLKIVNFLIQNGNSVSFLKLTLFCRQHKIQFPQIINSINEKSNQSYNENIIISENRKLYFNENFLK